MKLTGVVLVVLAAGLLSWAIFSAHHPFLDFPGAGSPTGTIPQTGTRSINLYFSNATLDPGTTCPAVFPVERSIADTPAIIRDAVAALVAGPSEAEKKQNYATALDPAAVIQSLRLEDGLASLDFDRPPTKEEATSCEVRTGRAELEATLRQFPSVTAVMISANGQAQ